MSRQSAYAGHGQNALYIGEVREGLRHSKVKQDTHTRDASALATTTTQQSSRAIDDYTTTP
eukprot:scaffold46041_cov57-Attheya_sp.AAC.1